jgi:hypothetical protein
MGAPGYCEYSPLFYVDKRERMIVFVDVVAALVKVVA